MLEGRGGIGTEEMWPLGGGEPTSNVKEPGAITYLVFGL